MINNLENHILMIMKSTLLIEKELSLNMFLAIVCYKLKSNKNNYYKGRIIMI